MKMAAATTAAAATRGMRQRAELTYKQNVQHGRHGWLRLTPAYSVRLVDQVLAEFGADAKSVFEPFSGTGTTPLCAGYRGLRAVATDINPFLIWLGRVKGARYSEADAREVANTAQRIAKRLRDGRAKPAAPPPLKNIERWWSPPELAFVTELRSEVTRVHSGRVRDLAGRRTWTLQARRRRRPVRSADHVAALPQPHVVHPRAPTVHVLARIFG